MMEVTYQLQDAAKINGYGVHRTVDAATTIERIEPLLEKIGVTRVADITGLDRLGIPVVSATVPEDKCAISVNNGKGFTFLGAKAGALMETLERYSAENVPLEIITGSFNELSKEHKMMNPYAVPSYIDLEQDLLEVSIDWTPAQELFSSETVLVPAHLVGIPWGSENGKGIWIESTNGLGSGNVNEEAICHALNELVERDAHTLAVLEAQLKPNIEYIMNDGPMVPSNHELFKIIDLDTVPEKYKQYIKKINDEGLQLIVRDITSAIQIPTFSATLVEEDWQGKYYCHGGAGTHPDPEIALERAITEAAQSRLTDIQGAREDMADQQDSVKPTDFSFLTIDKGSKKSFEEVKGYKNTTVKNDILQILQGLAKNNLKEVYLVNLTLEEIGIPVVRLIVPGLENWVLNKFDMRGCVVGERGAKAFGLTT
ncbi:YcaO-like family protein [Lysinibacillus sp. NPDC093688]|uniref:YcaO-like family protein n=1 Tax=Lysinibacillus sp. NPDC093688 TaxID=3390577 RepID=UPI003D06A727